MVVNHITIKCLEDGEIKHVGILAPYTNIVTKCKVLGFTKVKNDYVLKLKTPKDWQTGPNVIYRGLGEVI